VPKLPLAYCGSSPLVQSLSLAIRALTAIVLKRKPENKEKFFPNTKNQNDLELTKRNLRRVLSHEPLKSVVLTESQACSLRTGSGLEQKKYYEAEALGS
jgi:hypothetical protein